MRSTLLALGCALQVVKPDKRGARVDATSPDCGALYYAVTKRPLGFSEALVCRTASQVRISRRWSQQKHGATEKKASNADCKQAHVSCPAPLGALNAARASTTAQTAPRASFYRGATARAANSHRSSRGGQLNLSPPLSGTTRLNRFFRRSLCGGVAPAV